MDQEIKDILEAPFAAEDIKKDFNGFDYVDPHLIIRRLNKAFGQDGWQFVPEERIEDDFEIIQYGKIGIIGEGSEWVWKHNCGGKRRTYSKGAEKIPANRISSTNDYKSAISNCLKRCAMMFGIALALYGPEELDAEKGGDNEGLPGPAGGGKSAGEAKQPKDGNSGSADGRKPDNSIGSVKNRLRALESRAKAGGMSQSQVNKIKESMLGDKTLDHSKDKLIAYGTKLSKECGG